MTTTPEQLRAISIRQPWAEMILRGEKTVIKHPDRAEATRLFNYPFEAIEEALVNAVYHRG